MAQPQPPPPPSRCILVLLTLCSPPLLLSHPGSAQLPRLAVTAGSEQRPWSGLTWKLAWVTLLLLGYLLLFLLGSARALPPPGTEAPPGSSPGLTAQCIQAVSAFVPVV